MLGGTSFNMFQYKVQIAVWGFGYLLLAFPLEKLMDGITLQYQEHIEVSVSLFS